MWADAETDRLLEAGRHAPNDADREKHFREVHWRMHDEAPMLASARSRLFLVARKSIRTCAATAPTALRSTRDST
jgi:hypothetical protein